MPKEKKEYVSSKLTSLNCSCLLEILNNHKDIDNQEEFVLKANEICLKVKKHQNKIFQHSYAFNYLQLMK